MIDPPHARQGADADHQGIEDTQDNVRLYEGLLWQRVIHVFLSKSEVRVLDLSNCIIVFLDYFVK